MLYNNQLGLRGKVSVLALVVSVFFSLSLLSLLIFHIYSYYITSKNEFDRSLVDVFEKAVTEDLEQRRKKLSEPLTFGITSVMDADSTVVVTHQGLEIVQRDSLNNTTENKNLNFIQTLLVHKNPIDINALDSLFREELIVNRINGDFTILYEDKKGKTLHWSKTLDDMRDFKPILSEPLILGSNKEISLQAYFKFSPIFIFSRMPIFYWIAISGWFLLVSALIAFIPYLRRMTKEQVIKSCVSQVLEVSELQEENLKQRVCSESTTEKKTVVVEETEATVEPREMSVEHVKEYTPLISQDTISITDSLLFDNQNRKLFNQGIVVLLDPRSLSFIYSFLKAQNHFLTMDNLKSDVWGNENVTSDAVRRAISRLNKSLENVPELMVVNVPRKGYRLEVREFRKE